MGDILTAVMAIASLAFIAASCSASKPPPATFDCRAAIHDLDKRVDQLEGLSETIPPDEGQWNGHL
jgi:hypothetical protein